MAQRIGQSGEDVRGMPAAAAPGVGAVRPSLARSALLLCAAAIVVSPGLAGAASAQTAKPRSPTAAALSAPSSSAAQPRRGLVVEADGPSFRLRPDTLSSFTPATLDVGRFTFTAPGRPVAGIQPSERSFRFTPSGAADRKAVSLGVTARSVAPAPASAPVRTASATVERAVQPFGFNLDLAVGWNGFAVSGGVSRLDTGVGNGMREGVDVAFSYGGSNWKTSVQATAERSPPLVLRQFDEVERFGIEAGGAYALGRSLSVLGGVRYRTAPANASLLDPNVEDKSVYVGGAVAF
jgi:hypothetical protein